MDNLTFKRVSDCSLNELVDVWNRGFEGYSVDVTMTPEAFLKRMVSEDLSPSDSVVAFDEQKAVGIIMNGFREINGKTYAWNGGTGIDTDYRGKGVSQQLMDEVDHLYREKNVDVAVLEAISTNARAIKLYEKHHYELVERLTYFKGPEDQQDISVIHDYDLEIHRVPKEKIRILSFYQEDMPWQNQLESLKDGFFYILYDRDRPIGYATTKENYNSNGRLQAVQLFQVGIEPALEEDDLLLVTFLHRIFRLDLNEVKRLVVNFPNQQDHCLDAFHQLGFQKMIEQVHMKKTY
ncbi:GNAT family N-acetyltransferase [Filobacillus milosensis]|uniref:GNAT family N-acetyltransferase n=1 Tax=Filobacillus milosensis TaxID=94137 RepID=A0A4Y8IKQ3_9BACI|nr:GNAT family N-acetyltransferase [Filobacillus milosensis]TFB21724.1 GNAT family N-acetyltransferase [Filobacillus milosensis]